MRLNKRKQQKDYSTVEDVHLGKMIISHGINNNIIITHPSHSGVYQDEEKLDL